MMRFKYLHVLLCVLFVSCGRENESQSVFEGSTAALFPIAPNTSMTPGSLCDQPTGHRYKEKIPYCSRDVDPSLKYNIILKYDEALGFKVHEMPRQQFKIDHHIPLCMGGSNQENNLWPQHETVYSLTDPLEQKLCELMAAGKMTQAEAVQKIKSAKLNYKSAPLEMKKLSEIQK